MNGNLTRDQKLNIIKDFHSINNIEWKNIQPNEKNDWINLRDGLFDSLLLLSDKKNKPKNCFFTYYYSNGIKTNRDSWCYNFNRSSLINNIKKSIDFYNEEVEKFQNALKINPKILATDFLNMDATKFVWDRQQKESDCYSGKKYNYDINSVRIASYRPYSKQYLYFNRSLNNCVYQMPQLFPSEDSINKLICVPGLGSTKDYSAIIVDKICDLGLNAACQCFPLYWYEENKNRQKTLFDEETGEDYIRRDGITDWILKEVRSRYGTREITKEMIFYYVYGLLHSEDYRQRFAADLKKSLPRIPIVERVEDFMDFYKYGKKLADLHLNYETVAPYPGVVVKGDRKVTYETKRDPATGGFIEDTTNPDDYDYFHIWDKMRFKSKDDKSTIIYNGNITIENIPEKAYEYVVNGKSAIEWIVERYCVSRDKKSLIMNDANDWGKEHHKPRYILDLLLSVINVSVQTVDIVKSLPKLKFE